MENSDAWKRLNVMATSWVKKGGEGGVSLLSGSGERKQMSEGLDLESRSVLGGENNTSLGGDPGLNAEVLEVMTVEKQHTGKEVIGTQITGLGEAEEEELPGFDNEQMNILKALLHGVERESLIHVQGLNEPSGKEAKSWASVVDEGRERGDKFSKVKDSIKVAKERGVGLGSKNSGTVVPAGSYVVPGTYKIPDGEGGEKTIHFNSEGTPYEDGDPNKGYTSEEFEPRQVAKGDGKNVRIQEIVPTKRGQGGAGTNPIGKSSTSSSGRSWASVASASQKSDIKMRYFPTSHREVVLPPRENVEKWSSCLVGYIFDKKLDFNFVKNRAFYLWKNKGLKEVTANEEGFFIFLFDSKSNAESVFENGPYHIGGSWLVLKKWHRMLKLSRDQLERVPIWVKLFNVPLEYWDEDGLSRIASAIGVPLFMDRVTAQARKLTFARVCIEIEPSFVMPENIVIRCGEDTLEVGVVYQWLPEVCKNCKSFGHKAENCEKAVEAGEMDSIPVAEVVEKVKETEENGQEWELVKRRKGKMKVGVVEQETENVYKECAEAEMDKQKSVEENTCTGSGSAEVNICTAIERVDDQVETIQEVRQEGVSDLVVQEVRQEAIPDIANEQDDGSGTEAELPEEVDPDGEEVIELSQETMTPKQQGKKQNKNKRSGGSHRGGKKR